MKTASLLVALGVALGCGGRALAETTHTRLTKEKTSDHRRTFTIEVKRVKVGDAEYLDFTVTTRMKDPKWQAPRRVGNLEVYDGKSLVSSCEPKLSEKDGTAICTFRVAEKYADKSKFIFGDTIEVEGQGAYYWFYLEDFAPPPVEARAAPVPLNRWENLIRKTDLSAKQRAAYEQIAKLHTAKLAPNAPRGGIHVPSFAENSTIPTDVLYRMGLDILPMLAEALDDETPTATVTDFRGRNKVWNVNELAGLLIWRIADRDFVIGEVNKEVSVRDIAQRPQAAPEFRKRVVDWHARFAAKTPAERRVADVTDDWFRNRFDAIIWLGANKAKHGGAPIAARVDVFYADKKR